MNKDKFYLWLFFLLPILYFLSLPIATADLAVWIAHGKYFLSEGKILRHDFFSVLPTKELVYPFGTCLLYGLIYSLGGLIGVSLFHKLPVLMISYIWQRGSLQKLKSPWSYPSLLVIFLSWLGSSMFWVERPALLGMLALVLAFLILQKSEELSFKDLVLLNLINILWVNLHGSWPLLILMFVWRELGRKIFWKKGNTWQQLVAIFSFVSTSLINPFGYKIYPYLFETAALSRERRIDEWALPSIFGAYASQAIVYFLLVLLVIAYALLLFQKDRKELKKMLASPFVPLLFMGLHSIRNTALPFFVLIPFACEFILVKGEKEFNRDRKSAFNLLVIGFIFFCAILFFPTVKPYSQDLLPENKRRIFDSSSPFIDSDYLNKTNDRDPVFNDWDYGSFLILMQKHPIFIDTRNIIYDRAGFREYMTVIEAQKGWEFILEKYKIRYVLLNRKLRTRLIENLKASLKWKIVVVDNETILFQKKN